MLKYLTLTGIDVHCNINALKKLQRDYPAVEYGVLVSKNNTEDITKVRYPGIGCIRAFVSSGLKMSCHVCGSLAREAMRSGNLGELRDFLGDTYTAFQRFQFNINGCECTSIFRYSGSTPLIIQAGTEEGMRFFKCMNICNKGGNIQALVDSSGGRGEFGGYFEPVYEKSEFVGYAGGLGVDNVQRVLIDLEKKLGKKDFWIDMESSVRDANDLFDIEKARRVCELVFRR